MFSIRLLLNTVKSVINENKFVFGSSVAVYNQRNVSFILIKNALSEGKNCKKLRQKPQILSFGDKKQTSNS